MATLLLGVSFLSGTSLLCLWALNPMNYHGVACVAHLEHGVAVLLTTKLRGLNKSYTRNVVDYSCAISGAEPISRNLKTLSDEVPV